MTLQSLKEHHSFTFSLNMLLAQRKLLLQEALAHQSTQAATPESLLTTNTLKPNTQRFHLCSFNIGWEGGGAHLEIFHLGIRHAPADGICVFFWGYFIPSKVKFRIL